MRKLLASIILGLTVLLTCVSCGLAEETTTTVRVHREAYTVLCEHVDEEGGVTTYYIDSMRNYRVTIPGGTRHYLLIERNLPESCNAMYDGYHFHAYHYQLYGYIYHEGKGPTDPELYASAVAKAMALVDIVDVYLF